MVTLLAYSQWAGFGAFPLWQQELGNVIRDGLKENKCIAKHGNFKILEIKMNFWNPYTECRPFWTHSARWCCRDFKTNAATPGYKGCPAALPSVSAQKLIAADLHSLHLCWLVQSPLYLTAPKPKQNKDAHKISQMPTKTSLKNHSSLSLKRKKVKSCITFTES